MLDVKKLQAIRDVVLGVASNPQSYGDLNSTVYLQQIRDAYLGVSPADVSGNLHEIIYLQQIRNAIRGVTDDSYGSLPVSIYLQQIINAFNGVADSPFGNLSDNTYLDQVLAAAHTAGKAPNLIAGLTGWWEAFDPATLFTDAGVTPVTGAGDLVYQMNDKSGNLNHWVQTTAARRPVYGIGLQNGKSGLVFDGTNHGMRGLTIGNIFAANGKTLIMAVKIHIPQLTEAMIGDVAGFWTSQLQNPVSTTWATINFGGSELTVGITIVPNVALVYSYWHNGISQQDQKNKNAPTAVVLSGNTAGLATAIYLGGLFGTSVMLDGEFYGGATYNVVVPAADRNAVIGYFMQKLGIA